jgi:hypothetical protein
MITVNTLKVNQVVVTTPTMSTLFSYDTPIATKVQDMVYLHDDWNYSMTTGKYRNIFLGEDGKETKKKLLQGKYKLLPYKEVYDAENK